MLGSRRSTFLFVTACVLALVCAGAVPASAQDVEPPVAHVPVERGTAVRERVSPQVPSAKSVDGRIADWIGAGPSWGGALVYSAGELIYSDFLFDAYGADDGADAERRARFGAVWEGAPVASRSEHLLQQASADLDLPVSTLDGAEQYGNAGFVEQADLVRLRLAADDHSLFVLARTTTMTAEKPTAVLMLIETSAGNPRRPVPFGAGISTTAETAVFIADGAGRAVDLATGAETTFPAVANAAGYSNVLEAAVPLPVVGSSTPRVAVATGAYDPTKSAFKDLPDVGPNIANVAFRMKEPVRTWMDLTQALALGSGSIDNFGTVIDVRKMRAGASERWRPGTGYHERVFVSSADISEERALDGIHQHYGVYIPRGYTGAKPVPATYWMHWRGGKAHSAATLAPRIMRDMGESRGGLVIAPRGRGTSTWYLGKGHVDFRQVWADALGALAIDRDRVYVSGHSMGGWGTYLLSILYPDRFAAALPVAAPVTQGAWTGVDYEGCDAMRWDEYTPCYIATNDSDPRSQHTRPLLENLRTVPIGIFQGGIDELVPTSGVTRQAERLVELGYTHRYYVFPTYEHYTHPVVDEWMAGVRYMSGFKRDRSPSRVTYVRDMVFERTVERGPSQFEEPESGIEFSFDRAFWMSGLEPRDAAAGTARFDGRSLALPESQSVLVPEALGPSTLGQTGPFVATGLREVTIGKAPARRNAFDVTLDGAKAVTLDVEAMGIVTSKRITGTVDTSEPLTLRLAGAWRAAPDVQIAGASVNATLSESVLSFSVPAGEDVAISVG